MIDVPKKSYRNNSPPEHLRAELKTMRDVAERRLLKATVAIILALPAFALAGFSGFMVGLTTVDCPECIESEPIEPSTALWKDRERIPPNGPESCIAMCGLDTGASGDPPRISRFEQNGHGWEKCVCDR